MIQGIGLGLIIILVGVGYACWRWFSALGRPQSAQTQVQAESELNGVPTIFLPGYFGNRFSFGFLLRRLVAAYAANKSMVIFVDRHGKLKVIGDLADTRSLVQVVFRDKTSRPKQQAEWLMTICELLATQYGVAAVNLVGHSMGCITIFWFLTHHQQAMPLAIKRVITIAGPFNDSEIAKSTGEIDAYPINATGPQEKTAIYRALARKVMMIPKGIKFLNIAGTISTDQQNDGQVSLNSAFSLRYLLRDPLIYYRELVIRGKRATHRLLHENRVVDAHIAKFIWNA
ncbi:hydrolase [Lentilactobacillus fungorum]|uniref:Hydrolase n=1 Tax=Lentilactobacillus fungorum TaxID=2201250 RepID=A0ABQ3W4P5_9LACO|nr:alpha/beta hydrolase [Lentilactobacillus fungorum]GHP15211.1 hydrolase [Lentilactobacillus fungorum]